MEEKNGVDLQPLYSCLGLVAYLIAAVAFVIALVWFFPDLQTFASRVKPANQQQCREVRQHARDLIVERVDEEAFWAPKFIVVSSVDDNEEVQEGLDEIEQTCNESYSSSQAKCVIGAQSLEEVRQCSLR